MCNVEYPDISTQKSFSNMNTTKPSDSTKQILNDFCMYKTILTFLRKVILYLILGWLMIHMVSDHLGFPS